MIIGFQGEPGAFSEEAVYALFGDVEARGYQSFDLLVEAVEGGTIPFGLLPCENSIHGPVTRAYDLLWRHPEVRIVDETVHRIVQALIGPPGATIAGLRRVESHPVALEQCRRFLNGLPGVEITAVDDTAGAVRTVSQARATDRAAIGPAASAVRYGGVILADAVQDEPENYTRFFAVARGGRPRRGIGRAAVAFVLPHRPGSLYEALGKIAQAGLNLRALVARPLPGRPFEYVFYAEIDCPGPEEARGIAGAVSAESRLLGWY